MHFRLTSDQSPATETPRGGDWVHSGPPIMQPPHMPLLRFLILLCVPVCATAQFRDDFDVDTREDYILIAGDGNPTVDLTARDGHGIISIDATADRHNVWYTILKRDVSEEVDLARLESQDYELMLEARVRISEAPRRVNFMVVTNRTTDFHEHLREFDIADTTDFHTISFRTRDLDVRPGDTLYVQFCATEFGPDRYTVELDYFRADVVRVADAPAEQGEPLPYHPAVPELSTFEKSLQPAAAVVIAPDYPEVNFGEWRAQEDDAAVPVLGVARGQYAILRWDLGEDAGAKASGAGIIELTTQSLASGGDYHAAYGDQLGEEFPKVRIIEITGGEEDWPAGSITYGSFLLADGSEPVNPQMIFDVPVTAGRGGKTYVTLSRPVMQRLLDGSTKGLIIKPLGLINANFYRDGEGAPKLYFNLRETNGR